MKTLPRSILFLPLLLPAMVAAADVSATLEGKFGRATIDLRKPSLTTLYLRAPDGQIGAQSLLSTFPRHGEWTQGGYTYVVDASGVRYESRLSAPEKFEVNRAAGRVTGIHLSDVKLAASENVSPVALEDWTFTTDGDDLVWRIVRRWQRDLTYGLSGTPGLFSAFHSRSQKNATTSTFWYDPLYLDGRMDAAYRQGIGPGFQTSINPLVDIVVPDTWAICKLWSNWRVRSDLRLSVAGGSLFRRGSYALVSEVGAVTSAGASTTRTNGQVETVTLRIASVDHSTTGYQLDVSIPDKPTESALKQFYTSLLNGGTVNDQRQYNFGNESDGWYVALSAWMQTAAIGAGVPAAGRISERPFAIPAAYRGHLRSVFDTVDGQGLAHFGYNQSGVCMDDHCILIIGTRNYAVHTGDLDFVRQNMSVMERMLGYFISHRNEQGLFDLSRQASAHWYYDTMNISGVSAYHNALFYKATCDLAEMENALGNTTKAAEYAAIAREIKTAFNRVLWKEDAPGGPRYLDWIDAQGREVAYFCDMCQWSPLAYGIASPEQARKLVATADARIRKLEKDIGYKGYASMSALWPVPDFVNPEQFRAMQVFPIAMNGGSYLAMTYWEIVGRAKAGDREGAWKRMKLFAQRAARDGWNGFNCFGPDGELEERARPENDGEPYLSDMVAVPAALVNGILGIEPNWEKLNVQPMMPKGWKEASAEIIYRGQRTRVAINEGTVAITPVGSPRPVPQTWSVTGNFTAGQGWTASDTMDVAQGRSLSLKQICADGGLVGLWKLAETNGPVRDAGPYAHHGSVSVGAVQRGVTGHHISGTAAGFDGHSAISVADDGAFSFEPQQSFTLQGWFKTKATGNQVLVVKQDSYCLGVKDGKLTAWAWGAGNVVREALGATLAADNRWHHVAAVFDRQNQQLRLYLDGRPDMAGGNPVDISVVGASASATPLTFGGMDSGFRFTGALAEVSVHRSTLSPEQFSFPNDYAEPVGGYQFQRAVTGSYTSRVWDWGKSVATDLVEVATGLNGGSATLTIETFNDAFQASRAKETIPLRDGVQRYSLPALREPQRQLRVTFTLRPDASGKNSPVVRGFRIHAQSSRLSSFDEDKLN